MEDIYKLALDLDKQMIELVIYYEEELLKGIIFRKNSDDEIEIVCKSNDISFWLNRYYNIIDLIKDDNYLYIFFNPILKKYRAVVRKDNVDYINEAQNVLLYEVDELSLNYCLKKLNNNIGFKKAKDMIKKRKLKNKGW